MGRRVGFVLVFVGLFLLFFGLFARVYTYPRLKKAPLDQYSEPVATGTGTYFNRSPDKTDTFYAEAGELRDRIIPCKTMEEFVASIRPP